MKELPDKLTFTAEEVAEILGIGRNMVYQLIRSGEIRSIDLGFRKLVGRHMLTEFLGMPDGEQAGSTTKPRAGTSKDDDEPSEWTYVITVKRLRLGERARIETERWP